MTLHEREHIQKFEHVLTHVLARRNKVCILTSPDYTPSYVVERLLNITRGVAKLKVRIHVCSNLTLPDETVLSFTLPKEVSSLPRDLYWNGVAIIEPELERRALLYNPINI